MKWKPQQLETAVPFKIEGIYCRFIRLTQGFIAIVDAADYEWLAVYKWQAKWDKKKQGFYAARWQKNNKPRVLMHREILGLNAADSEIGDHINGCTLINTRKNLRRVDRFQSAQNRGPQKNNSSGYKGVTLEKTTGRWKARIGVRGKRISLGDFNTKDEAAKAYADAASLHHGQFQRKEKH